MKSFVLRRDAAVLIALGALAACSDGTPLSRGNSASRISVTSKTDDSAAGTVDLGGSTYTVAPVAHGGTVSGTIRLEGAPPIDSVASSKDQRLCGTHASGRITASAEGLADVLVWVSGVSSGKALPIDKRVELDSQDCLLNPRVQPAVVGSTVNVFNDDRLLHRLVFVRAGTRDTLTVMPFFNDGQIVASEKLAKRPGIVAVTCALHPWTKAYIAVFDHPYFDVTEKNGKFSIDSLPAGSYTLNVWHEGMSAPIEKKFTVAAGGNQALDVPIKLGK